MGSIEGVANSDKTAWSSRVGMVTLTDTSLFEVFLKLNDSRL